jgi:DNA repair exonuclease SbcCD ATPase subunit
MITLKELRWNHCFSYGSSNRVNFVNAPLTQLVGKNGHGKSSIALILEEVLFNKNSKGIKKADILNRYSKEKQYTIELEFSKDGVDYLVKTQRGSTQQVKLYKNGADISAHTSTGTYKILEDILGIDHKAFCQIVYQSSAGSLEFLTATDTARKKFLIEILNLSKYTKAAEIFKQVSQELGKEVAAAQAKVNTVQGWLDKYEHTDLTHKELVQVPSLDPEQDKELVALKSSLNTIEATNKRITQNNTYKQMLNSIDLNIIAEAPKGDLEALQAEQATLNKIRQDADSFIKKLNNLKGVCPTCFSEINQEKVQELVAERQSESTNATALLNNIAQNIKQYKQQLENFNVAQNNQREWERYYQLVDRDLSTETLDKDELITKLKRLEQSIEQAKQKIKQCEQHNQQAQQHNAKVDAISKQLEEMQLELEQHCEIMHNLNERLSIISVLTKTFSTTGLVAYKIECLVKDLEQLTNEYLVDLSDGRFQISFKISTGDKLNVVITDNGHDIEINALSNGELARVNAATLLAIRKLMQGISSNRINLLILDETVEALDVEGKEKLVEVLLKEEYLNTFLVSHGFQHPLLEKVFVVKTNNVSKVEA